MTFQKLLFCGLLTMQAALFGMQPPAAPKKSLKKFDYNAASVMPYTIDPATQESFILLGREALSPRDKGTYDAFGGVRDRDSLGRPLENHPVQTAAREFAEETIYILGGKDKIRHHIDVDNNSTNAVIVKQFKRYVLYITYFDSATLSNLTHNFYAQRAAAKRGKNKEKNALAWVSWTELATAIQNAKRYPQGKLKEVYVQAYPVLADGRRSQQAEKIKLRPILVSMLKGYFSPKAYYETGKNKKIRFYK